MRTEPSIFFSLKHYVKTSERLYAWLRFSLVTTFYLFQILDVNCWSIVMFLFSEEMISKGFLGRARL